MRLFAGAMALLLAGCTLGDTVLPPQGEAVSGPAPPYRKVIAAGLAGIVGDPKSAGTLQISGLRQVESVKGTAWMVCLRSIGAKIAGDKADANTAAPKAPVDAPASKAPGRKVRSKAVAVADTTAVRATPLDYAVFLQQDKIVESRLAVRADHCEDQAFEPFKVPGKPIR